MAAERLRSAGALVIEFTPWRIESYDDAKTAMLTAVVDEIAAETPEAGGDDQDPSRYDRARQAIGRLRRRVRWMRVAGLAAKPSLLWRRRAGLRWLRTPCCIPSSRRTWRSRHR